MPCELHISKAVTEGGWALGVAAVKLSTQHNFCRRFKGPAKFRKPSCGGVSGLLAQSVRCPRWGGVPGTHWDRNKTQGQGPRLEVAGSCWLYAFCDQSSQTGLSQVWGLSSSPMPLAAGPCGEAYSGLPRLLHHQGPVAAPAERRQVVGPVSPWTITAHSRDHRGTSCCLLWNTLHARNQTRETLSGRRASGWAGALVLC